MNKKFDINIYIYIYIYNKIFQELNTLINIKKIVN